MTHCPQPNLRGRGEGAILIPIGTKSAQPRSVVRITKTRTDDQTIIKIDGQLTGETLPELKEKVRTDDDKVTSLDLVHTTWIDDEGLRFLREMIAKGTIARRASPFIRQLLKKRADFASMPISGHTLYAISTAHITMRHMVHRRDAIVSRYFLSWMSSRDIFFYSR